MFLFFFRIIFTSISLIFLSSFLSSVVCDFVYCRRSVSIYFDSLVSADDNISFCYLQAPCEDL